ncbi:unnamed protein product [Natator depressus]
MGWPHSQPSQVCYRASRGEIPWLHCRKGHGQAPSKQTRGYPKLAPAKSGKVQPFLGVVGYYRRFIPHFATRASPLTDLIKVRGPDMVKWTDAAEKAFMDLRTALCSNPVLIAPDFNKEFILQTDASELGLRAVLSQMFGDEENPILYLSRKLLLREQKYVVAERECLAVKWTMETLHYYLLGRRITLVTEHAPLQWMQRNKEKKARVTRWFLSLQPFQFTIQHRAGSHHGNADGLSQVHCLMSQVAQNHSVEHRGGYVTRSGQMATGE